MGDAVYWEGSSPQMVDQSIGSGYEDALKGGKDSLLMVEGMDGPKTKDWNVFPFERDRPLETNKVFNILHISLLGGENQCHGLSLVREEMD